LILMSEMSARANQTEYKDNLFRTGHVNYLAHAIQMLYAGYRRQKAQELYDWILERYKPTGPEWGGDLEEFVFRRLNQDGTPIPSVAISQISMALQTAFLQRAAGSGDGYRESLAYALRVYNLFQKDATQRTKLPEFDLLVRDTLINLLARPWVMGVNLLLVDRAGLYASVDESMRQQVYPVVSGPLRLQCQAAGLDFDRAFPAPGGLPEGPEARQGP